MTLGEKSEFVGTPQADLRVLGDSRDHGGRRHLRFRDAVALLRETEFEDWPHLGSRATKEFLTSIRVMGLATSRTTTRTGCVAVESQRAAPSVIRMLFCASLSDCSLATIK